MQISRSKKWRIDKLQIITQNTDQTRLTKETINSNQRAQKVLVNKIKKRNLFQKLLARQNIRVLALQLLVKKTVQPLESSPT